MREAYLHRLANAGIPGENDTIIAPDFLKQLVVVRANEQHVGTNIVVEEDALSVSGVPSFHHRILTDAFSFHRTQGSTDPGQLWLLGQLKLFETLRPNDGKIQGRLREVTGESASTARPLEEKVGPQHGFWMDRWGVISMGYHRGK